MRLGPTSSVSELSVMALLGWQYRGCMALHDDTLAAFPLTISNND